MKKIICIFFAILLLLAGCDTKDLCKDGHTWTDATCKEPKICQVCNITEGNPTEHFYNEYTTISEATCTENGKEESTCIWCEVKNQRDVSKLEHTTEWEITTPATSNSEGLKSLKCQKCGEIISTEIIPKVPQKTTPNSSNTSSQSNNNSIGAAYDYVNSAYNNFNRASRLLTNIETMYMTGTMDNRALTYYKEARTLIQEAKTKLESAYDIFNKNNVNHLFNTEVVNFKNVVPILIDSCNNAHNEPTNSWDLFSAAQYINGICDSITDILYETIIKLRKMEYLL